MDSALFVSVLGNIAQAVGNVYQGIKSVNGQQLRSTIDALKEENESLRNQLTDLQAAKERAVLLEAGKAAEVEKQLQQGARAWEQQQREHGEILARGKESFIDVVRFALAAAEVAEDKFLKRIDFMIEAAKELSAAKLKLPKSEIDRLYSEHGMEDLMRIVQQNGRSAGMLLALRAVRDLASEGMSHAGRMTLLYYQIMSTGLHSPSAPIRETVRDYLDARPLFLQENDIGEKFEVCVTMSDIDRKFQAWAERQRLREQSGTP